MSAPYYEDGSVTIYHSRCEDVLPYLNDVGLVLTSPPYNLSGDGWKVGGRHKLWTALEHGYGAHGDDLSHAEYREWQHDVLHLCWLSLSPDGAILYNHKPIIRGNEVRLPFDLIPPGLPLRQVITWDRGSGFCRNLTHLVPTYEWLMVLANDEFRFNTRSLNDLWRIPFETGGDHPAPFPLKFATTAIGCTEASLILDPFAGSGTTLRAAKDLGRTAIGIEIEERYCEIAAKRCAQEVLDFGGVA